jgi:hypothetical protein
VVSRVLGFLDRSRYFFFQVAPLVYSLLLRKSGGAGNGIRTSGSVARNSDHKTAEAVLLIMKFPQSVISPVVVRTAFSVLDPSNSVFTAPRPVGAPVSPTNSHVT